jgi:cholesterol transport system auxiliary component
MNTTGFASDRVIAEACRFAVAVGLFVSLAACALVTPPKPAPETYDISAPREFPGLKSGTRAQILVKEPTSLKAIDGQQIVLKQTSSVIAYLRGAQWSDSAPKMLQSKLVEAFENTARAAAVAKPGDGLVIDYQLVSHVRRFEIDVEQSEAVFEIAIKLLNDQTGKVIDTQIFEGRATLSQVSKASSGSQNNDAYVDALDAAFDEVARAIILWVFAEV